MKNKTQSYVDKAWQENIESRLSPTASEIEKQALEELLANYNLPNDYAYTNYKAYKNISNLYKKNKILEYETIAKNFNIENRTEYDLQTLKEFIIAVTLMNGSDILRGSYAMTKRRKAQGVRDILNACELMSLLLEAIDS